jgi:hypothetical protein
MTKRIEKERDEPKEVREKCEPRGSLFRGEERREQPRPKVPLLSGGKDPTLAERFEEELRRP